MEEIEDQFNNDILLGDVVALHGGVGRGQVVVRPDGGAISHVPCGNYNEVQVGASEPDAIRHGGDSMINNYQKSRETPDCDDAKHQHLDAWLANNMKRSVRYWEEFDHFVWDRGWFNSSAYLNLLSRAPPYYITIHHCCLPNKRARTNYADCCPIYHSIKEVRIRLLHFA